MPLATSRNSICSRRTLSVIEIVLRFLAYGISLNPSVGSFSERPLTPPILFRSNFSANYYTLCTKTPAGCLVLRVFHCPYESPAILNEIKYLCQIWMLAFTANWDRILSGRFYFVSGNLKKVIEKISRPKNICVCDYFTLIVLCIELLAHPCLSLAPRLGFEPRT